MSPSIIICPATCELCGQWMPGHSKDCPRSGVHPSQWTLITQSENRPVVIPLPQEVDEIKQDDIVWEDEETFLYPTAAARNNMITATIIAYSEDYF